MHENAGEHSPKFSDFFLGFLWYLYWWMDRQEQLYNEIGPFFLTIDLEMITVKNKARQMGQITKLYKVGKLLFYLLQRLLPCVQMRSLQPKSNIQM